MSGGGSSVGDMNWPDYMKGHHDRILDRLQDIEESAQYFNPFLFDSAISVFNPDNLIDDLYRKVTNYSDKINAIENRYFLSGNLIVKYTEDFCEDFLGTDIDEYIDDAVNATGAFLSADIESSVLPRFKAGMRDINAVQSSSFILGIANIEAERVRNLASFDATLRTKSVIDYKPMQIASIQQSQQMGMSVDSLMADHQKSITHAYSETKRMGALLKNEQQERSSVEREAYRRWPSEAMIYQSNALAGMSGGVPTPAKKSKVATALGGAISGAATGAMIGSSIAGTAAASAAATGGSVAAGATTGATVGSSAGWIGASIGAVVGIGMALLA